MTNFKNIEYLKVGIVRQQLAYIELVNLEVFNKLSKYNPILMGTISIDIGLPESDLDIICECDDHTEFSNYIIKIFGSRDEFKIDTQLYIGIKSTIARFKGEKFNIEIFSQSIPTEKQYAYRHMLIEYRILKEKGENFKSKIYDLKKSGLKTEPAFAKLLGLKGNPYEELLKLE